MRICLDISPAVHHRAGIGRYARELAAALAELETQDHFAAFYNRASVARLEPPFDRFRCLPLDQGDKPWRLRVMWAYLLGIFQDRLFPGVDLFHATDHLLPRLSRIRTVFTLHDLTFRLYPQTHSRWNRWFLTLMMPRFLRAADAVIADSESTRRDAVRLYGIDAAAIQVIYPGVSAHFRPIQPEDTVRVCQRHGLPQPFFLYVGTIEPRKNLIRLLEAYSEVKRSLSGSMPKLVMVGKKGWLYGDFDRKLSSLGLEGEVVFPGHLPDADLPAVYSAAAVFVYPSLYEGFGLPPLEAMACGAPVICSNTSSLPEVVGEAAITVNPDDGQALAEAMRRVLGDNRVKAELGAKGRERASRFTWRKTAEATLDLYRSVLQPQIPT